MSLPSSQCFHYGFVSVKACEPTTLNADSDYIGKKITINLCQPSPVTRSVGGSPVCKTGAYVLGGSIPQWGTKTVSSFGSNVCKAKANQVLTV